MVPESLLGFLVSQKMRASAQQDVLDARFAMKELMTEEEWNQVFSAQVQ